MSLIDPVSGFVIPPAWMKLCRDPKLEEKVKSGRFVLLSNGRLLRRGLTTGTTAAAACKGALLSLAKKEGLELKSVEVPTPAGIRVRVAIKASGGQCIAVKEGGDHESDVTSGMEIVAKVVKSTPPGEGMDLIPGPGIGMITRSGLCAPKGKPAISQTARKQIMAALEEGRSILGLPGAKVEISVPQGEALASQTMNPKVGVLGGISLLGSTGFVEPWNEHLEDDLALQLRLTKRLVVTTGRTGLKFSRMLFPQHQVLLMGNKLDNLRFQEDQDSVLCGLPGLILKWALPGILEGTEYRTVAEMIEREPNHKKIEMALVELRRKLPFSRITLIHKDGRTFRDLEAP